MTIVGGPRREHEAIAANAIRWRRIENGEPCAAYVLAVWREQRLIAESLKNKARIQRRIMKKEFDL